MDVILTLKMYFSDTNVNDMEIEIKWKLDAYIRKSQEAKIRCTNPKHVSSEN